MTGPDPATSSAAVPPRAGIHVRAARPEDVARVWELIHELARYEKLEAIMAESEEGLRGHLFEGRWPAVECLVGEIDGRIEGYALFFGCYSSFRARPLIWLEDLYVTEASRGSGLGRELLGELAHIAVARDCVRIDWIVLDWNRSAIEFYERLGARPYDDWLTYTLRGGALRRVAGLEEA